MTPKEHDEVMAKKKVEAYKTIPIEFSQYIEQVAYERGHWAGQYEVDLIACEMVADIKPVIDFYNKRMGLKLIE